MNRILLIGLIGAVSIYGVEVTTTPSSADAMPGKSVYLPPSASVDMREEARIQNEDQNTTGNGRVP